MDSDVTHGDSTMSRRRLLGLGVVAIPAAVLLGTAVATTGTANATAADSSAAQAAATPPTTAHVYTC